jgi:hypothetical protein
MGKASHRGHRGDGGLNGGGSFHEHRGFWAKNKPTLSFTGVLPIGFLWAPTQIPPSVTSVRCFPVEPVSLP